MSEEINYKQIDNRIIADFNGEHSKEDIEETKIFLNGLPIKRYLKSELKDKFFTNITQNTLDQLSNILAKYNIQYKTEYRIPFSAIFTGTCFIEDISKSILNIYIENNIVNEINYNDYCNCIKEIHIIKSDSEKNRNIGRSEFTYVMFFDVSECKSDSGDFGIDGNKTGEAKSTAGGLTKNDQLSFVDVCKIMNNDFIDCEINAKIEFESNKGKKKKIAVLYIDKDTDNSKKFLLNGTDLYICGFANLFNLKGKEALKIYVSAMYKQNAYSRSEENNELSSTDKQNIDIIVNTVYKEIPKITNDFDMYYNMHNVLAKIAITCYMLNSECNFLLFAAKESPSILCIENNTNVIKLMENIDKYKDKIRITQHPSPNSSSQSQVFLWGLEEYECDNSCTGKKKMILYNKYGDIIGEQFVGELNQEKYKNMGWQYKVPPKAPSKRSKKK